MQFKDPTKEFVVESGGPSMKIIHVLLALLLMAVVLAPAWAQSIPNPVLFQMHDDKTIYYSTGTPCNATGCPGWTLIDRNPRTAAISGDYQLHVDGKIWRWDGRGALYCYCVPRLDTH